VNDRVMVHAVQNTKAALLPLTPREAWMEGLIERLPRRLIPVRLVPGHQIEVVSESRGEYKSLGDAPYFDLQFAAGDLEGAWLYVEGALVRNSGSRQARLEGKMAGGLGSTYTWPITTNLRGTIREVILLPRGIRQLRWIPTASHGFFSQTPLLVHKIGGIESGLRRWHRVLVTWGKSRRHAESGSEQLSPWRALFDLQWAYRQTAVIRAAAARGDDYPALLARQERMAKQQIARNQARLRAMVHPPTFTFLVSVVDSDPDALMCTIESLRKQIYPHWELLLVVGSTQLQAVCNGSDLDEPRVRWVRRESGAEEANELNDALGAARGDFVGMLEMGDSLQAASLLEVALASVASPESDVVYGDEDSLDRYGQRVLPRFKPSWNPDLLLSTNYVGLPVFFRRATVRAAGGFSSAATAAESYDLLLRLMELQPKLNVLHVPGILCSRRHRFAAVESQPGESESTPSDRVRHAAEMRALSAHLARQNAAVSPGFAPGYFRVRHAVPTPLPLVSLIMPTRDRYDVLQKCISSIQSRTSYPNWELLVVNNGSSDMQTIRYLESLTEDCRIRVLDRDQPFNYAALNNYAVGFAKGEVLGLLNNDLEVLETDWLSEMVSHAVRPAIGAVGAKLVYPDGMVQHAGVILGIGGVAAHVHKFIPADAPGYCGRARIVQNLSAVTGACLIVRASLYREVGGMNEAHLAVAFNDIDFCLKLRAAGYRNLYTPHAVLVHHESISRGRDDTAQKRAVFEREFAYMQQTWRGQLARDPAYNPNLSLEFADFTFSSQPWVGPHEH